jgi:hypothetical protein
VLASLTERTAVFNANTETLAEALIGRVVLSMLTFATHPERARLPQELS